MNRWLQRWLPSVQEAVEEWGVRPSRAPAQFAEQEQEQRETVALISDGTARGRQRPKDKAKQALHDKGKQKTHREKNSVGVKAKIKRVGDLSQTDTGKGHDKKIVEAEPMGYPPDSILSKDSGFQGDEPNGQRTQQPKKSPARER